MRVICSICAWVCESPGVCGMELHGQLDLPGHCFLLPLLNLPVVTWLTLHLGVTSFWKTDEDCLDSCPHGEGSHLESFKLTMGLTFLFLPNVFILDHLLG